MTICKECNFFKSLGDIWYNHFCHNEKTKRNEIIDPVTGEIGYIETNSLDEEIITSNKYPFARQINHGDCIYYEEKQTVIENINILDFLK